MEKIDYFFRRFGTVEKKLESSKQKIMVNFPDKLGENRLINV